MVGPLFIYGESHPFDLCGENGWSGCIVITCMHIDIIPLVNLW